MIGPKMFVLDYLLLPTFLPGQVRPKWDRFFARVHWEADFPLPPNFYTLVLADEPNGTSVSYHYKQMEPFNLDLEECGDWLEWDILSPPKSDDIKGLRVMMGKDPADPTLMVGIGAHLDYPLWIAQMDAAHTQSVAMNSQSSASPTSSASSSVSHTASDLEPITRKDFEGFTEQTIVRLARAVESKIRSEIRSELRSAEYRPNNRRDGNNFRRPQGDYNRDRSPNWPNRNGNGSGDGGGPGGGTNNQLLQMGQYATQQPQTPVYTTPVTQQLTLQSPGQQPLLPQPSTSYVPQQQQLQQQQPGFLPPAPLQQQQQLQVPLNFAQTTAVTQQPLLMQQQQQQQQQPVQINSVQHTVPVNQIPLPQRPQFGNY